MIDNETYFRTSTAEELAAAEQSGRSAYLAGLPGDTLEAEENMPRDQREAFSRGWLAAWRSAPGREEPKAEEPAKCAGCGEYWPCSDSERRDIRPELRAAHYMAQPKAEEPAQVYLILSNEAGRWLATELCDADGERFALSVLDVGGLVSAYRATPQQINSLMSASWSRRVHPTHLAISFGLEELELGNVIG